MTRLPTCALLVAAACGAAPIESTTILGEDSSSSTSVGATTTVASETSSSGGTSIGTTISGSSDEGSSSVAASESTSSPSTGESGTDTGALDCAPILHEVLYDPDSGKTDDEFEWIELYNPCPRAIALATYELRWGGEAYANIGELSGEIAAGGCFVVGGPTSAEPNDLPVFDLVLDFEMDLQNADSAADGIALFVVGEEVPVDAVIYGDENFFQLIDETGVAGAPDVDDVMRGHTIARAAADAGAAWLDNNKPSPNVCPNDGA